MDIAIDKADKPAIGIGKNATVMEAVRLMVKHKIGAVLIMEGDRALGIFSERDLMTKVVLDRLNPETTPIVKVMTTPVVIIGPETPSSEALRTMSERHFRHLPVANKEGAVVGMLSIRNLMQEEIEELVGAVDALEAYAGYDGATG